MPARVWCGCEIAIKSAVVESMDDDAAPRFLRVADDLLILATKIGALVKRIESVGRVAPLEQNRELDSRGRRIVERLTAATEMAEADLEHEFETLCQRLVARLDALR